MGSNALLQLNNWISELDRENHTMKVHASLAVLQSTFNQNETLFISLCDSINHHISNNIYYKAVYKLNYIESRFGKLINS